MKNENQTTAVRSLPDKLYFVFCSNRFNCSFSFLFNNELSLINPLNINNAMIMTAPMVFHDIFSIITIAARLYLCNKNIAPSNKL